MSTFTAREQHTARTEHRCSLCFRRIEPGEVYTRQRGYDGGDAWTFKSCAHCTALMSEFPQILDFAWLDQVFDCDAVSEWAQPGNARDMAEARAMVGWRMKWRTRGGRLLPLPEARAA